MKESQCTQINEIDAEEIKENEDSEMICDTINLTININADNIIFQKSPCKKKRNMKKISLLESINLFFSDKLTNPENFPNLFVNINNEILGKEDFSRLSSSDNIVEDLWLNDVIINSVLHIVKQFENVHFPIIGGLPVTPTKWRSVKTIFFKFLNFLANF